MIPTWVKTIHFAVHKKAAWIYDTETDGTIGIVSKVPIPRQLVSVSVSIQAFFESRYQSRYRSRALSIFWKVLAEFLLSKVSVSISVPVQFHGISISIGLDVDWVWVFYSVVESMIFVICRVYVLLYYISYYFFYIMSQWCLLIFIQKCSWILRYLVPCVNVLLK